VKASMRSIGGLAGDRRAAAGHQPVGVGLLRPQEVLASQDDVDEAGLRGHHKASSPTPNQAHLLDKPGPFWNGWSRVTF